MIEQCSQTGEQSPVTGYLHPQYAASFDEFGTQRELPMCGGWILQRNIPGSTYRDAMGCYPLFSCRNWHMLAQDLHELEGKLVSLALVTDPFGDYIPDRLAQSFHIFFRYKEHYVSDLTLPLHQIVSKHHRKQARKALQNVTVMLVVDPREYVDEWTQLYDGLISRHDIRGIRKFSRRAFGLQLEVPGVVYFRVLYDGKLVGGNIYYIQGNVVFFHLSACTDEGYALGAAYAVKWAAMEYFAGKATWMDIGGGAGKHQMEDDGLAYFKRGWASGTRPVYFCGRILDEAKYAELAVKSNSPGSTYFPIYRADEFV